MPLSKQILASSIKADDKITFNFKITQKPKLSGITYSGKIISIHDITQNKKILGTYRVKGKDAQTLYQLFD